LARQYSGPRRWPRCRRKSCRACARIDRLRATSNGAVTADRIICPLRSIGDADDPERAYAAAEALAAIQRLFASDVAALKVITGLISGMVAEDIRRHYDLTAVEYDTTRRRIRRTMLRRGLAWSWPLLARVLLNSD
jgi:hypothetical protein